MIGTELDVVAHHGQFHPNEFNGKCINNKSHLNVNCIADDFNNATFREAVGQFGVDEACKVTVKPIMSADEFVAEAEAGHESALFEPEYGA